MSRLASDLLNSISFPPHGSCSLLINYGFQVEFKDVKMRYRPGLPLVLRGLNVTVAPRTRVGVVGRTGAGKTSLINSLFRLMELDSGKIVIDGVDTSKLGLHQLRGSMSLIPQVSHPVWTRCHSLPSATSDSLIPLSGSFSHPKDHSLSEHNHKSG